MAPYLIPPLGTTERALQQGHSRDRRFRGRAWSLPPRWGGPPVCRCGHPLDAYPLRRAKPEVSLPSDRRSAPRVVQCRSPPIPKGLNPPAQGCEPRATLGCVPGACSTLKGLHYGSGSSRAYTFMNWPCSAGAPRHYHQGGADLRSAGAGILWMPVRYGERNRRYRYRQTGGLPHDVGILLLETNLQVTHARAVARLQPAQPRARRSHRQLRLRRR